jgi:hypothetical protein
MNNNLGSNGRICPLGSRKTGVLILNRVIVPGFIVNLKCYERIPRHEYRFWDKPVETLENNNIIQNILENEPARRREPYRRGYWVSREEKARIDEFLRRFLQGMQNRIGGRVLLDSDAPSYFEIQRGYGIVIYTNRGTDTDAKHVISEMTGTPIADVLDVDEARYRFLRDAEVRRQEGFPLNYRGAPLRNVPAGSENVISRDDIEDGTEMVDLLFSDGRSSYPMYFFKRQSFERAAAVNPRHPLNRHQLTRRNVVPYIARVAPAVSNGPAAAGSGAPSTAVANAPIAGNVPAPPLNRNARRRLLANAADRRMRGLQGGKTRKSKKSRSRKN